MIDAFVLQMAAVVSGACWVTWLHHSAVLYKQLLGFSSVDLILSFLPQNCIP